MCLAQTDATRERPAGRREGGAGRVSKGASQLKKGARLEDERPPGPRAAVLQRQLRASSRGSRCRSRSAALLRSSGSST
jgi:hypothetical protein